MLRARGKSIEGCTAAVSGSGNVAIYTIEKLYELGAKPVTCSDSRGCVYQPGGINLEVLKRVKEEERASLSRYAELCHDARYIAVKDYGKNTHPVWEVPCQLAFPSATQNEVSGEDAASLIKNGCFLVCEGANMPSTPEAVSAFLGAGIAFGPGKCANAGGVSTSQLEMAQNAGMQAWTFEEVDAKLRNIMATSSAPPTIPRRNSAFPETMFSAAISRGSARLPMRCLSRESCRNAAFHRSIP